MEDLIVTFFASFYIYFLFIGLLILWVIDGKIKKEQVIHALFACLVALLTAIIIKYFFPTLRPFVVNGKETDVLIRPITGAFPSEHTAIAFALSVTVFLHDRRVGWWFLASALVIGLARVAANVHYPADIIGGAFLGTIIAVIMDKVHFLDLINKLSPRKKA
jgi:undecaprenyl-diphosphatase